MLKLNCDGAMSRETLRDSEGKMIVAFSRKLNVNSILDAELRAISHGLQIVQDKDIQENIVVETNSGQAVKLLTKGCPSDHGNALMVQHISGQLASSEVVEIKHIWREANSLADTFAKFGFLLDEFKVFVIRNMRFHFSRLHF
ncbi:hypothetical protein Fmac_004860 [Flemingia macrophylla]|uniref:RNase H type-1 domain-containing protein n=1 Tax=Flemingia macrophylla TaxID=520843 RepID=A0ABD1N631_9FABA